MVLSEKKSNVAKAAIDRELACFIWEMMTDIYDEYSKKINDKTPQLVKEYTEEAAKKTGDIEDQAEIFKGENHLSTTMSTAYILHCLSFQKTLYLRGAEITFL